MINHNLKHKTAFITGAGGGIGRQIALEFAKAGATIGVADINLDHAHGVCDEIKP